MRTIHLSNEKKRDAQVGFEPKRQKSTVQYRTPDGKEHSNVRFLKSTIDTEPRDLVAQFPDVAAALIEGDPEVDMELVGRKLEELKKVFLTPEEKVAHAVTLTEHIFGTDGTEKSSRPQTAAEANINLDALPVRWTGKLFPKSAALRKFVFARSYQLRHVNGLTFDFLYEIAKKLDESKSMVLLGGGEKGMGPLVMSANGTAYRAFLEGRVDGEKYILILRLTNMELKALPTESEAK